MLESCVLAVQKEKLKAEAWYWQYGKKKKLDAEKLGIGSYERKNQMLGSLGLAVPKESKMLGSLILLVHKEKNLMLGSLVLIVWREETTCWKLGIVSSERKN